MMNKRLPGYLSWRRRGGDKLSRRALDCLQADLASQDPDHIAVTGDLTNLGTALEYRQAADWLDSLGRSDEVSVVPGNHDCYVTEKWADTLATWQPWMGSDDPGAQAGFPFVRRRGPVALIGVSTACPTPFGMATGYVGRAQRQRIAAALNEAEADGYFRVVLIHHPPQADAIAWRKRLTDGRAVRDLLSRHGAELVLHGHAHRFINSAIPTGGGFIPVLGAPGAAGAGDSDHERAGYYRLSLDCFDAAWRLTAQARTFAPESGGFQAFPAYSCQLGPWPRHAEVTA
jgi:3',5'-cyclic AMP phosphodiesterase CpdA